MARRAVYPGNPRHARAARRVDHGRPHGGRLGGVPGGVHRVIGGAVRAGVGAAGSGSSRRLRSCRWASPKALRCWPCWGVGAGRSARRSCNWGWCGGGVSTLAARGAGGRADDGLRRRRQLHAHRRRRLGCQSRRRRARSWCWSAGCIGFAIQGPAEELLFRGYILENVRAQWGVRRARGRLEPGLRPAARRQPGLRAAAVRQPGAVRRGHGAVQDATSTTTSCGASLPSTPCGTGCSRSSSACPNSGIDCCPDNALFTRHAQSSLPAVIWGGGFGPEGTLAASLVCWR